MHLTFDQARTYYENRLGSSLPAREKNSVRCPFHHDSSPSATVFLDGANFFCHVCTLSLSVVKFEMRFSKVDSDTAQKNIAEITGATLNGSGWKLEAMYTYRNTEGLPVSQKRRYRKPDGEKTFVWYCRDSAGRWQKSLAEDTPRLLYNQPELTTCNLPLFAEGEGCADALSTVIPKLWLDRQAKGLRIAATTNPEGAWKPGEKPKWRSEYTQQFGGKPGAVLFEDNDEPGRTLIAYVAAQIHSLGGKVRIVRFRDQREKYDIKDWIDEHRDDPNMIGDLEGMIENAPLWKPDPAAASATSDHGYQLVSLKDLFAKPDVPRDWVWDERMSAGTLSMIVAKPKVGKGTTARNLALCVATGKPFLGMACKQGKVVYLALEECEEDVRADFKALGATGDEEIYIRAAPAPQDAVPELIALVRRVRPRLLVVDPIVRLTRIRDENAYAENYAALGPLIDIARECGTHIVVLHHSGKTERADAIDSPLGSTAYGGAPASLIYLKRTSEGYRTIQTVQRIGKDLPETVLIFDEATKRLTTSGMTRQQKDEYDAGQRIIDYLGQPRNPQTGELTNERTGKPIPHSEKAIRENVEGKTKVLFAALKGLFRGKIIERSGAGKKGDPYVYTFPSQEPQKPQESEASEKLLFPCSHHITETREQESENGPETRMPIGEIIVPGSEALEEEPEQAFSTREQEKSSKEEAEI
jgi:hypothetical protein